MYGSVGAMEWGDLLQYLVPEQSHMIITRCVYLSRANNTRHRQPFDPERAKRWKQRRPNLHSTPKESVTVHLLQIILSEAAHLTWVLM
jgi:hypothetical protein